MENDKKLAMNLIVKLSRCDADPSSLRVAGSSGGPRVTQATSMNSISERSGEDVDFFRYDGANPNDLIIFQINMRHAAVVTHEIRDLYTSRDADIILMQEPYTSKGKLTGIGIGTKVATAHNCEEPRAAIVAHRDRVSVTKLSQFCDQHTVFVEVQSPAVTFYAVSCYFQFTE